MNGRAGGLRRRRRSERLRLPRRAVLPSRASVPRRCAGFGDAAAERDALRDAPGARPRGDARDGARSVARIVSLGLRAVAALALAGHRRQVVLVPVGVAAVEPRQHPAPHNLRVDHVVEDGAAGRRECPASSASELTDVRTRRQKKATGAVDQVEPRIRSRRDDPGLTMMSTRAWLETAVVRSCPDSPSRLSHPHRRSFRREGRSFTDDVVTS